jgi:hypothetical protein
MRVVAPRPPKPAAIKFGGKKETVNFAPENYHGLGKQSRSTGEIGSADAERAGLVGSFSGGLYALAIFGLFAAIVAALCVARCRH